MAMAAQSAMVRSESRRRLPDPPSGVEPVTVQSQFCQNESIQLEQRMQGLFPRDIVNVDKSFDGWNQNVDI